MSGLSNSTSDVAPDGEEFESTETTRSTNESSGIGNPNAERESIMGKTIGSMHRNAPHGLQRQDRKPVKECIFCDLRQAKKAEIVAMVRYKRQSANMGKREARSSENLTFAFFRSGQGRTE